MGAHLIDGEFQSDKYPTCPRGKVPLSVKDPRVQDLLWAMAQRWREVDLELAEDLETALTNAGYVEAPEHARTRVTIETLRHLVREKEALQARAIAAERDAALTPFRMVLQCPQCGKQHVDRGEWATRIHKTHRCVDDDMGPGCRHEWKPSEFPTVGVATLQDTMYLDDETEPGEDKK